MKCGNSKRSVCWRLVWATLCCLVSLSFAQTGNFIGEIRMFAGNFPPAGWMLCDGSLLPISQYDVLFNILGTTYGGDGQTTFALPDLRGRMPIHGGNGSGMTLTVGQTLGQEQVTLTASQMPAHTHTVAFPADSTVGSTYQPGGKLPSRNAAGIPSYSSGSNATMNSAVTVGATGGTGGGQPVPIMPPFLCINFIIQVTGVFPTQN